MQIVQNPATFRAVRYQLYKSQILPVFFSLFDIFNSNTKIKSSNISMARAKMKSSSSKKRIKLSNFLLLIYSRPIVI